MMQILIRRSTATLFMLLASLVSFQFVQAAASQGHQPHEVARETTEQIIKSLKDKQALYKDNEQLFFQDVEKIIDPVVAFDDMARGVMGKYASQAWSTPEQVGEFARVFRDSLARFFSRAVMTFDTSSLILHKVEPVTAERLKEYENKNSRYVQVALTVGSKEHQYGVSYHMIRKNGVWMIRNITVEGINIGLQFRGQFADLANKYSSKEGKVKKVIAAWPELMNAADKKVFSASQQEKKEG